MLAIVLQHVPFEGPAALGNWLSEKDAQVTFCHLHAGDNPASLPLPDLLIIMGGPMGVHDEHIHPWLAAEKAFIQRCLDADIPTLGICLGAQLIAHVLGAAVTRNPDTEIGWFPLRPVSNHPLAQLFEDQPEVLHWHGDTFAIPEGAERLLASDACANQAFIYQKHALGLQFHMESTAESVQALIHNSADELVPGDWIQTAGELKAGSARCQDMNRRLSTLLEAWLTD